MNQASSKSIEAIVIATKIYDDEVSPSWNTSKSESYFNHIRVYSGISDEEIGSVMFKACLSSSDDIIKETASETLEAFISDEGFVLSGGLEFKENDEIQLSPGCCCGLEDWDSWFDVPNGNTKIWNGHDPFCLVEIDDEKIKIWSDEELKNENPSIEFLFDELIEHMKNVEKDLKNFLIRLAQWTKNIEPALEKHVVEHFAKNMNIKV